MQNFMETIVHAVKSWTTGEIIKSTADWNQNDASASDYIKNKPLGLQNSLLYTEQSLTDEQKIQARANIGAASTNVITIDGGATTFLSDVFGEAPYTIEFTADTENVTASNIEYDGKNSGINASNVQEAIDILVDEKVTRPTIAGLTTNQISALDGMFKIIAYTQNASTAYTAFKVAFGIENSGDEVEPDEPDEPIIPDEPDEPEKILTSISTVYSGGSVTVGTVVSDLTGIAVTANYSDGTSESITGYTLTGEIAEGNNIITVSYGGKTATFTVTGVYEESEATLPSGYTQVEYLQSSGSMSGANGVPIAYIDTGYLLEADDDITFEFEVVEAAGSKAIFGARDGTNHVFVRYTTTNNSFLFYDYSGVVSQNSVTDFLSADNRYTIKSSNHTWTITDGANTESVTTKGRTDKLTQPLYLFCENNAGVATSTYVSKIRLYSAQITNDGVKANYIPCLDAEGIACLYESVSGQTLYNSGSGEFIVGGVVS